MNELVKLDDGSTVQEEQYSSFEVFELMHELRTGSENAVSRQFLCREMDVSDRKLRKIIEQARTKDMIPIINLDNGYFIAGSEEDVIHARNREFKRAISCFKLAMVFSNILKRLRHIDNGQIGLWEEPESHWISEIERLGNEVNGSDI